MRTDTSVWENYRQCDGDHSWWKRPAPEVVEFIASQSPSERPEVAPHTFLCEKSVTPGDIHYFADGADLNDLLSGFSQIDRKKIEGYWDNRGTRQFYSNWSILARKTTSVAH